MSKIIHKTIYIASDHSGVELKKVLLEFISNLGYKVEDIGAKSQSPSDYPDFAKLLTSKVVKNNKNKGILICGTGIGMSISANKTAGIRAALCYNEYSARMSREHNNTNVLCLGSRVIGVELAKSIVSVWLKSKFSKKKRYKIRIKKIED